MNQNKLIQQRARGERARTLMENELLQEAFEKTEQRLYSLWQESDPSDEKGRERLYLSQKLLGNLKTYIGQVAATGKAADKELTQIQGQSKVRKMRNRLNV